MKTTPKFLQVLLFWPLASDGATTTTSAHRNKVYLDSPDFSSFPFTPSLAYNAVGDELNSTSSNSANTDSLVSNNQQLDNIAQESSSKLEEEFAARGGMMAGMYGGGSGGWHGGSETGSRVIYKYQHYPSPGYGGGGGWGPPMKYMEEEDEDDFEFDKGLLGLAGLLGLKGLKGLKGVVAAIKALLILKKLLIPLLLPMLLPLILLKLAILLLPLLLLLLIPVPVVTPGRKLSGSGWPIKSTSNYIQDTAESLVEKIPPDISKFVDKIRVKSGPDVNSTSAIGSIKNEQQASGLSVSTTPIIASLSPRKVSSNSSAKSNYKLVKMYSSQPLFVTKSKKPSKHQDKSLTKT